MRIRLTTIMGAFLSLAFLFSSASRATDEIVLQAVKKMLDEAIEKKILHELEKGKKSKSHNFYPFYYDIPVTINKDFELRRQFITCLSMTVKEHRLVGPKRRPLTLVPKGKVIEENYSHEQVGYQEHWLDNHSHDDTSH